MKYQVNIKELKEWVSAYWLESRINDGEQTPEDTKFLEKIVNAMLYDYITHIEITEDEFKTLRRFA